MSAVNGVPAEGMGSREEGMPYAIVQMLEVRDRRISELEDEQRKSEAGLIQLRLTASELVEENKKLRGLLKTFFYAGSEHGEWIESKEVNNEPKNFEAMLRANGLGEG